MVTSPVSERLIVGLDLSRPTVRLVLTLSDGNPEPVVLEHQGFRSATQFKRYWKRYLSRPNVQVAIARKNPDALDLIPWLRELGVAQDKHNWPCDLEVENMGSFIMWELPRSYRTAYALALFSSYRSSASRAVLLLRTQVTCVRESLAEIERDLHCLSQAWPA